MFVYMFLLLGWESGMQKHCVCSNNPFIRTRKYEKTVNKVCSHERNSISFGANSIKLLKLNSRYIRKCHNEQSLFIFAVFNRAAFEEHAKTETDFLSTLCVLYIRLSLPYVRSVEFGKELSLWAWQWIGWAPEILCCRVHIVRQVSQPKKISYLTLLVWNVH